LRNPRQRCRTAKGWLKINFSVPHEGVGYGQALGLRAGITGDTAPLERVATSFLERQPAERDAIRHHCRVGLARAIPFQHGELGRMKRARLAVPVDAGIVKDLRLAGGQKLLGREFRRGVEIERASRSVLPHPVGPETMKVSLVSGRHLKRSALDLGEPLPLEPVAGGIPNPGAPLQEGAAVSVRFPVPPRL
jgi:hypothetical protein